MESAPKSITMDFSFRHGTHCCDPAALIEAPRKGCFIEPCLTPQNEIKHPPEDRRTAGSLLGVNSSWMETILAR